MKLITDEHRQQLLENGRKSASRENIDPFPVAKIFVPGTRRTWLLTELDPKDEDLAFGLCDLGQGCPELGFVRISDIEADLGPGGLAPEHDCFFEGVAPLSIYADRAQKHGAIVTMGA